MSSVRSAAEISVASAISTACLVGSGGASNPRACVREMFGSPIRQRIDPSCRPCAPGERPGTLTAVDRYVRWRQASPGGWLVAALVADLGSYLTEARSGVLLWLVFDLWLA